MIFNTLQERIEAQKQLEAKYSKRQRRTLIKEYLLNEISVNVTDTELDILGILLERKSIYINSIIEMLLERNNLEYSKVEVAEALLSLIERNEVKAEIIHTYNDIKLHSKYTMSNEFKLRLKQLKTLPPMIVRPLKVNPRNNNRGSGYLSIKQDSLIMKSPLNHHKQDVCTEILDKVNGIQFTINTAVVDRGMNKWSDIENPRKDETEEQYKKRLLAFVRFQHDSYQIIKEMIEYGNNFYFTHKYDKRGRLYPVGYYITYMGNDFAKASVELANKEIITDDIYF